MNKNKNQKVCACGCGGLLPIPKFPCYQRTFLNGHNNVVRRIKIGKTILNKLYYNKKYATLGSVAKELNVSIPVIRKNIIRLGLTFKKRGFNIKGTTWEKRLGIDRSNKLKREQGKRLTELTKDKTPWNKGKKGLQVAWNKGLTKETSLAVKINCEKLHKTRRKNGYIAWNKGLDCTDHRVADNVAKCFPKLREYCRTHAPSIKSGHSKHGIRKDLKHYVRSRWEANICRLLKHFKIDYEFEPKTFYFKDEDKSYTPDIYIKNKGYFIEIIAFDFDTHEEKLSLLKKYYPEHKVFRIYPKLYRWLQKRYYKMVPNWEYCRVSISKTINNPKYHYRIKKNIQKENKNV